MMDREEIRAGLSRGNTLASIAGEIGRSVSTISREVANNGGRDAYRAVASHERADRCARRSKGSKLGVFRHRCGEFCRNDQGVLVVGQQLFVPPVVLVIRTRLPVTSRGPWHRHLVSIIRVTRTGGPWVRSCYRHRAQETGPMR